MSLIFESGGSPGVEMATRSNILAWEIPCEEEPGGQFKPEFGNKEFMI